MADIFHSKVNIWKERSDGADDAGQALTRIDGSLASKSLQTIDEELEGMYNICNSYPEMPHQNHASKLETLISLSSRIEEINKYFHVVHGKVAELDQFWNERIERSLQLLQGVSDLSDTKKYKVDNVLSLNNKYNGAIRPTLGFEDFMVDNTEKYADQQYVKRFVDLYKADYDQLNADISFREYGILNVSMGLVVFDKKYTEKTLFKDILDHSVIVPLWEAITGQDIVYGYRLTDAERKGKLGTAGFDALMLATAGLGMYAKGLTVFETLLYSAGNAAAGMAGAGVASGSTNALLTAGVDPKVAQFLGMGFGFATATLLAGINYKVWDNKLNEPHAFKVKPYERKILGPKETINTAPKTTFEKLDVVDFTDDILETKPKHSPTPKKWIENKGGSIEIDKTTGYWKYIDADGNAVTYKNGYPDFSPYYHKTVKPVKIKISSPRDDGADFKAANKAAGLGADSDPKVNNIRQPPKGYTWHHLEDGETMVLVDKQIHYDFKHQGGQSAVNGKGAK